ncbi:HU family DNA-binding protein [Lactococcus piscium]|uniref:HU family DNA-binding protein n=1 Tax=Pseudolactococcus carnosus TaxID=2749961 RepID=UPI001FBABCCE|nr:HU family DNA-binding protein [Lactococcus carnosus]MCJ1992195.1 HU family DNA-binding protein [Lactococcus carnosus]
MANKHDLVKLVAEDCNLTHPDALKAIDAVTNNIEKLLIKDGKVQLIGFGTFEKRDRAARTGRNPQTGEEIQIASTVVPAFKPGKALKEAVKPKAKATKGKTKK